MCLTAKIFVLYCYETIISPVVSYGCDTFSLTLRREYSLKALKKSFGTKRHEETGIGEGYKTRIYVHNKYYSGDQIKKI
jgi:hypothetical protein